MDVKNIITQIVFDGTETFIITKDKAVIERLSLDLRGKPSSDGNMAFDVSQFNILTIVEHKVSTQGVYFQLNKPNTEKKPEPKTTKAPEVVKHIQKAVNVLEKNNVKVIPNMPVKHTQKAIEPLKTEKPKKVLPSIHFEPKKAQEVVTRFKQKPQEKDLWSED